MEVGELVCEMEMHLLIHVFDIQFHHIVHIVEDVELVGPSMGGGCTMLSAI